jgi:N-acetylmuramoyl-L-alanine amidase
MVAGAERHHARVRRRSSLAAVAAAVTLTLAAVAAAAVTATGDAPAAALPLAGVTIAVDPGHNGHNGRHPSQIGRLVPAGGFRKPCDTTGTATSDGTLTESAFNLSVALRLRRVLRAAGATVVMTRRTDTGVGPCVNERAAIGNRAHADVAISIHADGAPVGRRGFHVIHPARVRGYTEPIVRPSLELARLVRARLRGAGLRTSNYAGRDGLSSRSDLGGLNLSKVPKVLVELGNMKDGTDASRMRDGAWRQRVAQALARSLQDFAR